MNASSISNAIQFIGYARIGGSLSPRFRLDDTQAHTTATAPSWLKPPRLDTLPAHLREAGRQYLIDQIHKGLLPYASPREISPQYVAPGHWLVLLNQLGYLRSWPNETRTIQSIRCLSNDAYQQLKRATSSS